MNINYIKASTLLSVFAALLCIFSQGQAKDIQDYIEDIPGIGLVADKINFEGITLSGLTFIPSDESDEESITIAEKYVLTKPQKKHRVVVSYDIDADVLKNLDLHHFIYGLHKSGPQDCFLHSLGIRNDKGTVSFIVQAPEKPGVYQLRFCHATGYGSFESIKDKWWMSDSATSETIMGIVIVNEE